MIPWMVYAALTAVLIAAGALAVERLVASRGRPRRYVWLAALTLAVVVPLLGDPREPPPTASVPTGETAEAVAPAMVAVERTQGFVLPLPIPPSRTAARTAGIAWGAGIRGSAGRPFHRPGGSSMRPSPLATPPPRRHRRLPVPPLRPGPGGDLFAQTRHTRVGPAGGALRAGRHPAPRTGTRPGARDHLALLYAAIVAAAFPWSPAIWWMCRRLRAAIEIDCDRRVIASGIGAADYGALLLQTGSRSHGRWGLAPAMSQPASILERRLRTMNEKEKETECGARRAARQRGFARGRHRLRPASPDAIGRGD